MMDGNSTLRGVATSDAELIRICEEHISNHREFNARAGEVLSTKIRAGLLMSARSMRSAVPIRRHWRELSQKRGPPRSRRLTRRATRCPRTRSP